VTNYTLDLITGLTQVLDDDTNTYLYGLDRVGEQQPTGWAYHQPDVLGSVRQLTDADAEVILARAYEPFGSVMTSSGPGKTNYSFTGEWEDGTGLMSLRARYYQPVYGRFLTRDSLNGSSRIPMSQNRWLYGFSNPLMYIDPTGSYNRVAAVSFAYHWDQDEMSNEFPSAIDVFKGQTEAILDTYYHDVAESLKYEVFSDTEFLWRGGQGMPDEWTDCANFASHVLWQGGVRDNNSDPLTDNPILLLQKSYKDTQVADYWNPKLMLGNALFYVNHVWGISRVDILNPFSKWSITDNLAKFLLNGHATAIPSYSGTIPHFMGYMGYAIPWMVNNDDNDKWTKYLHSQNIMPGDLVFYDTGKADFKWEHVAVIVGWGPQTLYASYPGPERWQDFPPAVSSAFYWWTLTGCPTWDWKPRVVDRAGAIQYKGSRSIDNTYSQIVDMQILHINQ